MPYIKIEIKPLADLPPVTIELKQAENPAEFCDFLLACVANKLVMDAPQHPNTTIQWTVRFTKQELKEQEEKKYRQLVSNLAVLKTKGVQREVLLQAGKGFKTELIAKNLFISPKTVETHTRNCRRAVLKRYPKENLFDIKDLIAFLKNNVLQCIYFLFSIQDNICFSDELALAFTLPIL